MPAEPSQRFVELLEGLAEEHHREVTELHVQLDALKAGHAPPDQGDASGTDALGEDEESAQPAIGSVHTASTSGLTSVSPKSGGSSGRGRQGRERMRNHKFRSVVPDDSCSPMSTNGHIVRDALNRRVAFQEPLSRSISSRRQSFALPSPNSQYCDVVCPSGQQNRRLTGISGISSRQTSPLTTVAAMRLQHSHSSLAPQGGTVPPEGAFIDARSALKSSSHLEDDGDFGSEQGSMENEFEMRECWVRVMEELNHFGVPVPAPSTRTAKIQRPQNTGRSFFFLTDLPETHWLSLRRLISSPTSYFRQTWDITGLILLTMDLVLTPMQVFEMPESTFLSVLRIVTATFWTLDIGASFLVGYHHKNGSVEMRPNKIAAQYLKSWFFVDITLVVLDWTIMFLGTGSQASSALRIGKVSRFMRAVRLLRLVKFRVMLEDMQGMVRSEFKRTVFYIAKLISFIVCVNHFVACGFYGLQHWKPNENAPTWVEASFNPDDSIAYRYSTALHWSLTQFTPASMEVTPRNAVERFYTVCVLLFALVTFSSFVSSITTAMTHLRQINQQKVQQESKLRRYLNEHDISAQLTSRVLHYIQQRSLQHQRQALVKEGEVELFKVLPDSIKNELRVEAFLPALLRHPFIFQYHNLDEQAVWHLCRVAVSERRLLMKEELFGHSKPVTHMLFVVQGTLKYTYPSEGRYRTEKVLEGQWCAEYCLWTDSEWAFEACYPVVAESNSELLLLSAEELASLVPKYPQSAYRVALYGALFLKRATEVAIENPSKVPMHGDQDQLQEIAQAAFEERRSSHASGDETQHIGGKLRSSLSGWLDSALGRETSCNDESTGSQSTSPASANDDDTAHDTTRKNSKASKASKSSRPSKRREDEPLTCS